MPPPTPSLSALLVCDSVIDDKITNKKTIVGAFTNIWSANFPCIHYRMGVYFCLTNAEGEYEIVLRLLKVDSEELIAEAGLGVKIDDILSINDFGINLPMAMFPAPGRYEFQLLANKQFLGRKEFVVSKSPGR